MYKKLHKKTIPEKSLYKKRIPKYLRKKELLINEIANNKLVKNDNYVSDFKNLNIAIPKNNIKNIGILPSKYKISKISLMSSAFILVILATLFNLPKNDYTDVNNTISPLNSTL